MADERMRADALNRFWNNVVAAESGGDANGDGLDPDEAEVVRAVHRLAAASLPWSIPDRAWPGVLRRIEARQRAAGNAVSLPRRRGLPSSAIGQNGRAPVLAVAALAEPATDPPHRSGRPRRWAAWGATQAATAALVVLTFIGGLLAVGRGRLVPDRVAGDALPAIASTRPGMADLPGVTVDVLAESSFATDALPADAAVGLYRATFEPGARFAQPPGALCGCERAPGKGEVGVDFVASGTYRLRLDGTVRVVWGAAATSGGASAPAEVAAETAITLAAGDAVTYPTAGMTGEARNPGPVPLVLVGGAFFPGAQPGAAEIEPPPGLSFVQIGTMEAADWIAARSGGPVSLGLRRVTLAPGASVPSYTPWPELLLVEAGALRLGVGSAPGGATGAPPNELFVREGSGVPFVPLRPGTMRAIRNASETEPLVYLSLTVTPWL